MLSREAARRETAAGGQEEEKTRDDRVREEEERRERGRALLSYVLSFLSFARTDYKAWFGCLWTNQGAKIAIALRVGCKSGVNVADLYQAETADPIADHHGLDGRLDPGYELGLLEPQ